MDLLALRHQFKEAFRAQLKKQSAGNTITGNAVKSADTYGCFFGHSEVVLADRLIKDAKSWLKIDPKSAIQELDRRLKKLNGDKKSVGSKTLLEAVEKKKKLQWIKDSRDYSCLLSSDDSPVQVSGKNSNLEKCSVNSNSSKADDKIPTPPTMEKKSNLIIRLKIGNMRKKKKLCSTTGEENLKRKIQEIVSSKKKSVDLQKLEKKRVNNDSGLRKRKLEERKEEEAFRIIRRITGYDPTKFSGDDDKDDANMEASFADIQKEERRSLKIARKEDADELKKIEEARKSEKNKKIRIKIVKRS